MKAELYGKEESSKFPTIFDSRLMRSMQQVLEEAEEDESESGWEPDEVSVATDDGSNMLVDAEDGFSEESSVGGHSDGVDDVLQLPQVSYC